MSAVSYETLALSWQPKNKRDKPFIVFTLIVFALFLGLGVYSNSIEVPKEDRRVKVVVPDRVAKFILDKPKPKAKPKPKIVKKPKSVPKPKPKPKVKRKKPKKEIALTKKQQKSRKNASESGLIALSDELSDLMDTSSIDSMVGNAIKSSSGTTKIAAVNTDILSAGSTKGSGGVNAERHLSQPGGTTKLDADQRAMARQLLTARAGSDFGKPKSDPTGKAGENGKKGKKPRTGNYRSEEDIAYIVDKNKSKLHAIYRRARRNNPGIKGKIVLEITILPSGKVENVRITSSELDDAKLESRIIARVKRFDFGQKNVKKVTVTYPIEFLPS